MLLTLFVIGGLTIWLAQLCSKSKVGTPKTGSDSNGSDPTASSTAVQQEKSKLFSKSVEKTKSSETKSSEPFLHEYSAQQPDRDAGKSMKMYELDDTQKDDQHKKGGKGLKLGNMHGSQSVTNTKNRKKKGKLDRTQKSLKTDEVNEDDDDTFQDAPSIEIKGGSSVEFESPANKSHKKKKCSRETVTKGSREFTGSKASGETVKKSKKS